MAIDKKDLEEIGSVLKDVTQPFADDIKALRADNDALKAEIVLTKDKLAELEKAPASAPQGFVVLSNGKQVRLGDGLIHKMGGAPAFMRHADLGDRPYAMGNLVRAIKDKDEGLAKLEIHVSNELRKVGFIGLSSEFTGRSYVVPLSHAESALPIDEAKYDATMIKEVRALLKSCLVDDPYDPYEAREIAAQAGIHWGSGRKAMNSMEDTAGGAFMPLPERGTLIEMIRAATVFGQAGAQQITLPPGGMQYPKETGTITFTRTGENVTIPPSEMGTGMVNLIPKPIKGLIKVPNSLIQRSTPSVEAVIRRAFVGDLAVRQELDYLTGAGGTNTPEGILTQAFADNSAMSATSGGPTRDKITYFSGLGVATNGNAFSPMDIAIMTSGIYEAPDPEGPTAWLMYPRKWASIKNARADAVYTGDQAGVWLWPVTRGALSGSALPILDEVPVLTTTNMPRNRTKGSATNLTAIILANFRRMVIGRLGVVELASSEHAGFAEDQTWLRVVAYDDMAILNPSSFLVYDQLAL